MSTKPMDWLQGPWSVHLYAVNRSSYAGLMLENRTFPHWIVSYVAEGEVTLSAGGEMHRVRAQDVMLHPPNVSFSESSDTKGTHLWMQVSVLCARQFDLYQLYRIGPVVPVADPLRFESTFQKLLTVWNDRALPFRDLKLTALTLQLTELILTGWERAGRPERSDASAGDRFARLIGYMSMRISERWDREQLAALVRLHPNYMDRSFQRHYGLTPMQMLRDMRLKRAKQLLEDTDETLESVAVRCGMTDASYLCKQFKKQFGLLPGEYRAFVQRAQADDLYGSVASLPGK